MDTRRYGEVSVLHIEPATYAKLLHLAETGPGRPGGRGYDPEDPWHQLIVEPHSYGCWVHTGIAEDGDTEGLPASLFAILREARDCDACWVLFDADLEPLLDLPVFEHTDGRHRPGRGGAAPTAPTRVVFSYPVPVCVVVEDRLVSNVVVIDETDVANCTLVEGDPANLADAVAARSGPAGASAGDKSVFRQPRRARPPCRALSFEETCHGDPRLRPHQLQHLAPRRRRRRPSR